MLPVVARAVASSVARKAANRAREKSAGQGTGEKPSLMLFGGLAMIALLKDILDFIGIGSLPALGTAVTLCFSFLIFMLLLLFDRSGGRANKRIAQGLVMTFFTLVEAVGFVLNFLPLQTLTIVFLYNISYRSWKEAEKANALNMRVLTKKQKIQQARLSRTMAKQEQVAMDQAGVAANAAAVTSSQTTPSLREQAAQTPRMTTPRSSEIRGIQQGINKENRLTQKAANDAAYTVGKNSADAAIMRIRAAGSRLSQASPVSHLSAARPAQKGTGTVPTARMDMKRAA